MNTKTTSPDMLLKSRKRFEWLTGFLCCEFKFVYHILGMMIKTPADGFGTMGVRVTPDGKFELLYDPAFFDSLSDAEATYVFYHEILHLALHHCTRRSLTKEAHLHTIANIACDLAVNELIPVKEKICEPPRDEKGTLIPIYVNEYRKNPKFHDIENRQSAEWYFDYLMKKLPPPKGGGGGGKGESGNNPADGLGNTLDDHEGWKEQQMADERVRVKIKQINDRNMWGEMSQTEKELILAAQVQKINWRNRIRVWFGNQAWRNRLNTRKRPNRRTGWMHPGTKTDYVDRWLVATDTSASVNNELLSQWVGVLNQIAEELPIDVMQFDCNKTEDPQPYDRRHTKFEFKGRGGTNFQPVMDMVNKRRYKGVMILTDGEAAVPTKPENTQVLWVLPAGCNPPVEWGDRIHLVRHV